MRHLIIAGSGIKTISHLTLETQKVIQQADKVLYLVNEESMKLWIEKEAKQAESLDKLYFSHKKRIDSYQAITQYIIQELQSVEVLCVIFYGHPTVFADSGLAATKLARQDGHFVKILPAVSALDCLFSDLEIDPGDHGCFSIDATELLIYERQPDNLSHLVLWQVANLGQADLDISTHLPVLRDYLLQFYPKEHQACLYEAANLPLSEARIEWFSLSDLAEQRLSTRSSLYIPPAEISRLSEKYIKLLEINKEDFQLSSLKSQLHK